MLRRQNLRQRQIGGALVISLIILLLMTLIGTTAMQTTVMEEKMAGNSRDQNTAFQAAEAGLRDGEQDIIANKFAITDFSSSCANGLCLHSTSTTPQWKAVSWTSAQDQCPTNEPSNEQTRRYGCGYDLKTSALTLEGVTSQPRYILEEIPDSAGNGSLSIGGGAYGGAGGGLYRITAQGYGAGKDDSNLPLARAMLQSVYRK